MMSSLQRTGAVLLAALLTTLLAGCNTCGFDCGDDDDENGDGPALLDLGFSDALPEDLQQVVIEVTGITLSRSGNDEDVVITEFTIPGENLDNVSSFQIDLLEYRGARQLLVIEDLELEAGDYNGLLIDIDTTGVNTSSVLEDDGEQKPIAVTGSRLSLSGFRLNSGEQALTVEFGLAQALQFRDASDDYLLTDNGVRLIDNADSVTLSGTVDPDLFDASPACDDKADPFAGNRIYLYEGASLDSDNLADVFRDDSGTSPPADAVAPFAVSTVRRNENTGVWEYVFGFVPPGDYTLAFACDAGEDDPVDYDELQIPLPDAQIYPIEEVSGSDDIVICDISETRTC